MKKIISVLLCALILISCISVALAEEIDYSPYNYEITTKIYGYDAENGIWSPVTQVKVGDDIKVRVFIGTNFYSGSATMMFGYDKSVLAGKNTSDNLALNEESDFVSENIDRVTFSFAGGTNAAKKMFTLGYISQETYDNNSFINCITYVRHSTIYDDSDWIFEFDFTVLEGSESKKAELFLLPETASTTDNPNGIISFPFFKDEKLSASHGITSVFWYVNTPVFSAVPSEVIHNVSGNVYREGYNPETDKLSFSSPYNNGGKELYEELLGKAGENVHRSLLTTPHQAQSYGTSALLAQLITGELTPADFGAESIADITAESKIDGVSVKDYIERLQLEHNALAYSPADCEDIYNAVNRYVYSGGDPVIINIRELSKTENGIKENANDYVLAVGLSGNNTVIVYDPTAESISTIEFGYENGKFTNEWKYNLFNNCSGNNIFDENAEQQFFIDYSTFDSESRPSFKDKNVLTLADDNTTKVTGADRSDQEYLYTCEKGSTVSFDTKDNKSNVSFNLSDRETSIYALIPTPATADVSHTDDESSLVIKNSNYIDTRFYLPDSNGNLLEILILGTPSGDTVTFTRKGNAITFDGIENPDVGIIRGSDYSSVEFDANGESVTIVFNDESGEIRLPEYTLKWVADGVTVEEKLLQIGEAIYAPVNPAKEGYSFIGWDTDIPDTMPANDLVFTAQFKANSYNAVFNANGGAFSDAEETAVCTVEYMSEIPSPEIPVKQGYNFAGWSLDGENAEEHLGKMDSVNGKNFIALWAGNDGTPYRVVTYTMDAEGNYSESTAYKSGVTDSLVTAEYSVEKGFVLNESKSILSGNVKADGSLVLEVYLDRIICQATINGEASDYVYGEEISAPQTPEAEEGYEFTGWIDENGNEITFPLIVDENLPSEINPLFSKKSYTVNWIVDGENTEETYLFADKINAPADPVKEGYTFIGWDADIPGTMPASNLTFVARFEKNPYICPDCNETFEDETEYSNHIAYELSKKNIRVSIKNNPGSREIKYGETLRLTAVTNSKLPAGTKICWYVDGTKKGEGETFDLKFESGTKTVDVKITDNDDTVLKDASSNEISDSQKVSVKSGFFQKIISFFKNLFRINRTVVQYLTKEI